MTYSLERAPGEWINVKIFRDGERIGHYWDDPRSDGFAAFRSGNDRPIARPKSERGAILKITNGAWDGTEPTEPPPPPASADVVGNQVKEP